jgi:tetratricopeptide (TPR) repeat protein
LFAAALLAKEECVAFPVFLALLHLSVSRNRAEWKPIATMFVCAVAAGARTLWVASTSPGSEAGAQAAFTVAEYFWTQGIAILRYLGLLVAPVNLTPDPPITPGFYWWAWVLIAAACAVALKRFSSAREGFWFVAAIVLLLPSSSVFPASELTADRRMYLPLVPFAALAGLALQPLHKGVTAFAVIALVLISMDRTTAWASDVTLWSHALNRNPRSVRARLMLARTGHPAAVRLLEEAKAIAPEDARVAMELGRVYLTTRGPADALPEFGRALAMAPNSPAALSNRGVALLMLNQQDAALRDFERALKMDPCFWEAHYNLKRMGAESRIPRHCRFLPELEQALDEVR